MNQSETEMSEKGGKNVDREEMGRAGGSVHLNFHNVKLRQG